MQLRISNSIENIFSYHEVKFLLMYYHLFGRVCSNPVNYHLKPVKKKLKEINLSLLYRPKLATVELVPGKLICPTCNKKLFKFKDEDEDHVEEFYISPSESICLVDQACSTLGISAASKIRKLGSNQRVVAIESNITKISQTLKRNLYKSFD